MLILVATLRWLGKRARELLIMSKYADIATLAVELVQFRKVRSPVEAWQESAFKFYPNSESARNKGCPKSAFLGLCEEGKVKGIAAGSYTNSKDNKKYALEALELIKANPQLSETELWKSISSKAYNQQMHVVLALYKKGWLNF